MHIYQAEEKDNIDLQINKAGNSIAFVTAKVRVDDIRNYSETELDNFIKSISIADLVKPFNTVQTVEELLGQEQPDLALIVAILVSTGWNKNDDIFTPKEVWKARSSPIHKPMNDNHDAQKILGHIVQSRVLDKSGHEFKLSEGEAPSGDFDLEVAGVLYRAFPELSERIDEIITKAKAGNMYVSMEALFPDFGYGFIDPATGDTKLIERTNATAFLTKHLRIYGGCGEYQGYKIGRVLKDIIFSAQGFCDEPANPESIIKVAANKMAASRVFVTAELSELSEGGVEDVNEKQLKELHTKLEEAQTSLASKVKKIAELQEVTEEFEAKDYDEQIAVLIKKVDELTTNVVEASEKVKVAAKVELQIRQQLDEATQRAEKGEAELEGIRKTETARERLTKLSKIKKVDDEEATLAEFRDMTDETFKAVLKYAGEAKSEKEEKEELEPVEAALNNVKVDNSADFNVTENAGESNRDKWMSIAMALCGQEEKEEKQ